MALVVTVRRLEGGSWVVEVMVGGKLYRFSL